MKVQVNNSPFIVTCFDESLNKKTRNFELDLHTHYWDANNESFAKATGKVEVRNSWVTKSSYETELCKMTSHFELLTRKCL